MSGPQRGACIYVHHDKIAQELGRTGAVPHHTHLWIQLVYPTDCIFNVATLDRTANDHSVLDALQIHLGIQACLEREAFGGVLVALDDEVIHNQPVQIPSSVIKKKKVYQIRGPASLCTQYIHQVRKQRKKAVSVIASSERFPLCKFISHHFVPPPSPHSCKERVLTLC